MAPLKPPGYYYDAATGTVTTIDEIVAPLKPGVGDRGGVGGVVTTIDEIVAPLKLYPDALPGAGAIGHHDR